MLKFLYRKNRYLISYLKLLLCNALIQRHFNCACLAWYPNLNKKSKSKLQTVQNRSIRYCLQLYKRSHIGMRHFEKFNCLPVSERFNQYLCSTALNFLKELVLWSKSSKYENFCFETKTSFKKHGFWSKKFFVSDTSCLEQFADGLKLMNSLNNFKHKLKNHFFKKL